MNDQIVLIFYLLGLSWSGIISVQRTYYTKKKRKKFNGRDVAGGINGISHNAGAGHISPFAWASVFMKTIVLSFSWLLGQM